MRRHTYPRMIDATVKSAVMPRLLAIDTLMSHSGTTTNVQSSSETMKPLATFMHCSINDSVLDCMLLIVVVQ